MSGRSSDATDQRDQLVERAKRGEITGAQADAEAVRLGLGSLSSTPSSDAHRAEDEPHWTLAMVLAWIIYLDLDKVRDWSAPYRARCWLWVRKPWRSGPDGPVREGWFLEQRERPTVPLLAMIAATEPVQEGRAFVPFGEARGDLWHLLQQGYVHATGIDTVTGRRVPIPPLDWHELEPVQGPGEADEVRRGRVGEGYREVLFPSSSVRGTWRRKSKLVADLPELMPPSGHGYMPLFCAAQWIATQGGRVTFNLWDEEPWHPAFAQLLAAIASEKVRVTGMRGALREMVPAVVFASLRVFYPSGNADDLFLGAGEAYLQSWPYIDEEHWHGGFNDQITSHHRQQWSHLMVEKGDVRDLWPFSEPLPPKSGTPGRPTSSHLFVQEMERRARLGLLLPSLAAEARHLSQWLADNHKSMPQAKPDSVRTSIRARYWELKRDK